MTPTDVLVDAFERIRDLVRDVVDGLSPHDLTFRLDGEANSIAWLVWHLTRVQDDHIADVAGTDQAWTSLGWMERFGLPLAASDTGYGHSPSEVALVTGDSERLWGYHEAVCKNTLAFVTQLGDADLERVVDERWDPPVTLGVRMVSVVTDDLQHVGQAALIRGILERM